MAVQRKKRVASRKTKPGRVASEKPSPPAAVAAAPSANGDAAASNGQADLPAIVPGRRRRATAQSMAATDLTVVSDGGISITPLKFDLSDTASLGEMHAWDLST